MKLKILEEDFSVCKLNSIDSIDLSEEFTFVSRTDEELSLVCKTSKLPSNIIEVENDWKCLKIDEVLDFSLIGIISKISTLLANNNIELFVISTYNTDYILIQKNNLLNAIAILKENNYKIEEKI